MVRGYLCLAVFTIPSIRLFVYPQSILLNGRRGAGLEGIAEGKHFDHVGGGTGHSCNVYPARCSCRTASLSVQAIRNV